MEDFGRHVRSPYAHDPSLLPESKTARAHLTACQAVIIFKLRVDGSFLSKLAKPSAAEIGRQYGVSEKTIRDIWTGRTWKQETAHLDQGRPISVSKGPGRPKGSKDGQKRREKGATHHRNRKSSEGTFFDGSIDDQLFEWERQSSCLLTQPSQQVVLPLP
jgi:hypothetical protein